MKTCLRALALLLLLICGTLPWLPQWEAPDAGGVAARMLSPEPQPSDARTADFEELFAPVPDELWADRDAALVEDSLREMTERMQAAALTHDELRSEWDRLGNWLETHRAETAVDLLGAWHGLRRLVDADIDHEYEVNRRKRKLLGQLLASAAD